MTVYVAEAAYFSLISRRVPAVNVPCDIVRLGAVAVLRLHDEAHALLPNPFSPPARRFWERRDDVRFHLVADEDGCEILHRAIDATVRVLAHRQMLREHVGLDDPGPALAGMLWELAGMLAERARIQVALGELAALPSAAGPETAARIAHGRARLAELTGAVDSHAERIGALASRVDGFAAQQAAADRHRAALRHSDFLIDPDPAPAATPSAAAELTERTAAVLDAYRDLTGRDGD